MNSQGLSRSLGRCLRGRVAFGDLSVSSLVGDGTSRQALKLPSPPVCSPVGRGQGEIIFEALLRKMQDSCIGELKAESSCALKPFPSWTHQHRSLQPTEGTAAVRLLLATCALS